MKFHFDVHASFWARAYTQFGDVLTNVELKTNGTTNTKPYVY